MCLRHRVRALLQQQLDDRRVAAARHLDRRDQRRARQRRRPVNVRAGIQRRLDGRRRPHLHRQDERRRVLAALVVGRDEAGAHEAHDRRELAVFEGLLDLVDRDLHVVQHFRAVHTAPHGLVEAELGQHALRVIGAAAQAAAAAAVLAPHALERRAALLEPKLDAADLAVRQLLLPVATFAVRAVKDQVRKLPCATELGAVLAGELRGDVARAVAVDALGDGVHPRLALGVRARLELPVHVRRLHLEGERVLPVGQLHALAHRSQHDRVARRRLGRLLIVGQHAAVQPHEARVPARAEQSF
mmetsp:Transcript_20076/g.71010  ORF Transcript_20076/g.71010 Transcript_20076/m.71010 type:complete len:301 (-) Transcript_20076:511-1413(-)